MCLSIQIYTASLGRWRCYTPSHTGQPIISCSGGFTLILLRNNLPPFLKTSLFIMWANLRQNKFNFSVVSILIRHLMPYCIKVVPKFSTLFKIYLFLWNRHSLVLYFRILKKTQSSLIFIRELTDRWQIQGALEHCNWGGGHNPGITEYVLRRGKFLILKGRRSTGIGSMPLGWTNFVLTIVL